VTDRAAITELSEELAELLAARLRVIGQPLRVRLITCLRTGVATVTELTDATNGVQQNVSQHLAILHQARILNRHKQGTRVYYELIDPHVASIIDATRESLMRHSNELSRVMDPE
jgi:DNA-binding transcriptional ArsR family regulator